MAACMRAFSLLLYLCLAAIGSAKCRTRGTHNDLPNPPTLETKLEPGSWLIPMDDHQYANGQFNLMSYGLTVRLIWANQPVKWAIKACKGEDEADLSDVTVRQILPFWSPDTTTESFKYGAFVLPPSPLGTAMMVYRDFLQESGLGVVDPVVYHVEGAAVPMEVRHSWTYKPKAAVLGNDKTSIHTNKLKMAGFQDGLHFENLGTSAELLLDEDSCFTFISNPHDDLKEAPERAVHVGDFVRSGGNFLAQCHAAKAYGSQGAKRGSPFLMKDSSDAGNTCASGKNPNSRPAKGGKFGSRSLDEPCTADGDNNGRRLLQGAWPTANTGCSLGCEKELCLALSDDDAPADDSAGVAHPDLAFAQFEHSQGVNWGQGGSWEGGLLAPMQGKFNPATSYTELQDETNFKAMAGTIVGYPSTRTQGGMVYYLGGHDYKSRSEGDTNAIRMYLNAALVPSVNRNSGCGLKTTTLAPTVPPTPFPTTKPTPAPIRSRSPTAGSRRRSRALLSDAAPDTTPTCPGGSPSSTCDYLTACAETPLCLTPTFVASNKLTCFPDYCGRCAPVWRNLKSGKAYECVAGVPGRAPVVKLFHYEYGEYGQCSVNCGRGMRTRTMSCADAEDNSVPLSKCSGVRADNTEACGLPCPKTDKWVVGAWGECSVNEEFGDCKGGTRTRQLTCKNIQDNSEVPVYSCDAGPSPPGYESCNNDGCGCVDLGDDDDDDDDDDEKQKVSSAPSRMSLSVLLAPILALWAMVVQA